MSLESGNIKKVGFLNERELTKKEVKTIRSLIFLSPNQEQEVRNVWKNEANTLGSLKHSIFFNLFMWTSIIALAANVFYKNTITAFADNIIVFAVFVFSILIVIASNIYRTIAESKDRRVILGHSGIMLLQESGFVQKYFGKITSAIFVLLYIGSGHFYTGIFLILAMLLLVASTNQAKENVKRELDSIS